MRTLPLWLVGVALVAGCFGGGETSPNERTFSASNGAVSAGWGYDGSGILGRGASLDGTTDDAANTGAINVSFSLDGVQWIVSFDSFAQGSGKDFQDGGIEHDLDEHGDTGVADASIPKIHALVAAWGSAKVLREGTLVTPEPWTAHLMVSADTVRGADDKITKADGATPYDPSAPSDARRLEGDPQVLMFIKHPMGETFSRGQVAVGANLSCQGPQCAQTAEIPVEEGATQMDLNVTYTATGPLPLAVGRATLTISDAEGNVISGPTDTQIVPGPTPTTGVISAPLDGVVGPLTVTLAGDGAFTVQIAGTVTYVDHPFLVFTWNEPMVS